MSDQTNKSATHVDCPCWLLGVFQQVPCPFHDGHKSYPKGAFAMHLRWLRDNGYLSSDAPTEREARLTGHLRAIRNIKDRIPFDAADAATECIRIAKEALGEK